MVCVTGLSEKCDHVTILRDFLSRVRVKRNMAGEASADQGRRQRKVRKRMKVWSMPCSARRDALEAVRPSSYFTAQRTRT